MNSTAFLITLVVSLQSGTGKPRTHSAESMFFTEVPDVPALLAAYEQAPLFQLIGDGDVQTSIQGLLNSAGVEVGPAVTQALTEIGIPAEIASAPLQIARGALGQVQSASMSVALAGDPEQMSVDLEKMARCLIQLQGLESAVASHTADHEGYPPSSYEELGLDADQLIDPWGTPYQLEVDLEELQPRVFSLGSDASIGGTGFASDFVAGQWGSERSEQLVHEMVQVLAEVEFRDDSKAKAHWDQALGLLEGTGWEIEVHESAANLDALDALGENGRVCTLRDPSVEGREAWLLSTGSSLIAGYGASSLDALLERRRSESSPASPISALASRLEPERGATVVQGWIQLGNLIRMARDVEAALEGENGSISTITFPEESLFRVQLDDDRFVSEYVNSPRETRPRGASDDWSSGWNRLQRCLGSAPLDEGFWDYVPGEAIGVVGMSFDGLTLYEEVLRSIGTTPEEPPKRLREIEQRFGFSIANDLFGSIGDNVGGYLLPITGVITIPAMALVAELDDAESFQRGIDGLLRLLEEEAGGEFSVRYKPYRKQPMWTFSFGNQGGRGGGMMLPISISPSLAIVDDHLLVTLTSARAKKEVKRLLAGEGTRHEVLTMAGAPPPEAGTVAYMNWPGFFNGTYDGARAALALFGGMTSELPFNPEDLPDSETFSRFFKPSVMWSVTDELGFNRTHSESSFGPETIFAMLGGGGALALSLRPQVSEAPTEPDQVLEPTEIREAPVPVEESTGSKEDEASRSSTTASMGELATRLEVYRIESGRYPAQLSMLLEPTPSYPRGFVPSGMLPADGWGNDFMYVAAENGATFQIWSLGADGQDGGGQGDDIRLE